MANRESNLTPSDRLKQLLTEGKRLVVLTGAGMSTESGIPDFRSPGGVWEDPDLMAAMTDDYLRNAPEVFWPKYKRVFMSPAFLAAKPNRGHYALAEFEALGWSVRVFTQNIDGLHQAAGSSVVSEVHGSAKVGVCPRCHQRYDVAWMLKHEVPYCDWETPKGAVCETILHPDTVLFGQPVRHLDDAFLSVRDADLVLVLGTSLTVEPFASIPRYRGDARLAIINLEPTHLDGEADFVEHVTIGSILPQVVAELSEGRY